MITKSVPSTPHKPSQSTETASCVRHIGDTLTTGLARAGELLSSAIRMKALLIVSVVFVAGTCSKRVDFEAVMHNMYLLPTVSRARKMSSERTGSSLVVCFDTASVHR